VAAELYIIDGDNVCHLRGGSDDYQRAREQLVAEVAGYMAQLGIDAFVVLDGHGRSRSIGRTQLTHSGRETADTVIERLAFRHADREVTVVSSDAVLRHVAQRGGVQAMSAREFIDRLVAAPKERFEQGQGPRGRRLLGDALDPEVRAALERMRRGE